jgi:acetyl esterase
VVVYLHGGGFVVGGLESHDDVCAELCARTGFQVVAADYRMSPEYDHPAAFDDAWTVYQWARQAFDKPVVLCGDSAGGNLAAAVAHEARNRDLAVLGQVLIYPGLGGNMDTGSYLEHAHAPMLTRAEIEFYADIRTRDPAAKLRPDYAPLLDSNFASLPPTIIFSAECDPLCDDGRDYRDAIQAAGGRAHWYRETGLVHGYLRARHTVARAKDSFSRIVSSVAALGKAEWPHA